MGSSDEVRMLPSDGPVCGMPMEKRSGGSAMPKMPSGMPYGATAARLPRDSRKVGGMKAKITVAAPTDIRALLSTGGTSQPTVPLTSRTKE